MTVDTMRAVDYYAGVPLCFLATITKSVQKLFFKGERQKPKNVLLIELSEMGSAILVDPAMKKLKANGAELHFLIFDKNRPSLELLNSVPKDNVCTIREDGLFSIIVDTLKFLVWARRRRIDSVIDLELFSRFTALLSGFCGASNIVGFHRFEQEGLYRGEMLTHRVAYNSHIHIAKNFIALVNALLSPKEELPYSKTQISDDEIQLDRAEVADSAKAAMLQKICSAAPAFKPNEHEIILFNANASDLLPLRRWSYDNYILLIKMTLESSPKSFVLLTGSKGERAGLDAIVAGVASERCVNFAGMTSFAELLPLYSLVRFMVSNDSGPAHFAAVVALPTFVFFGPETPKLYSALGPTTPIYAHFACSPCVSAHNHRKTPCDDNACLQAITPEMAFRVIKPSL